MKPTKIGNEWITSTYKNFPISRLQTGEYMKNKVKKIKKVIKGLKKASKLHAGQAKTLKKVISNGKKTR
mgnify:FL=1|tara:strand:+ start:265 stop:471 length:207 start_codon:yes stop_codon:yes gene_type:complete